jgi:hypothetical protein
VIKLLHKDNQWYDGTGQHQSEFDGVELVDFSISTFTNILVIKQLRFDGKPQKVDMIYFDELNFHCVDFCKSTAK